MKFGIFYELQIRARGKRTVNSSCYRTPSIRSNLPIALATTLPGKWTLTSSKNIRTRRPPASFSAQQASARRIFASHTAFCS